MKPRVYLDVDGVLNAVCHTPDLDVWPDYTSIRSVGGRMCYSPSVTRIIADWHESEIAEVLWLTTWEDMAQDMAPEVGLPHFGVAGTRRDFDDFMGWWKLGVVQRDVATDPGRPFVWIDDDLYYDEDAVRWLNDLATPFLAITPRVSYGLRRDELEGIDAWLEQYHAEVA
jgi:hypothetical protein